MVDQFDSSIFRYVTNGTGRRSPLSESALLPIQQSFGGQVGIIEHHASVNIYIIPVGPLMEPALLHDLIEKRGAQSGGCDVEESDIQK